MSTTDTESRSLVEVIEERQAQDRETAVYVEGDLDNDPPLGNAAATRVAHLITDDDEEVLRIDPEDATDHDEPENVGCVQLTLPVDPPEKDWRKLRVRLATRIPERTDIVVLVDDNDVPWFLKTHSEIRVVATGIDDPLAFYRVQYNPYDGEIYYVKLDGMHP